MLFPSRTDKSTFRIYEIDKNYEEARSFLKSYQLLSIAGILYYYLLSKGISAQGCTL